MSLSSQSNTLSNSLRTFSATNSLLTNSIPSEKSLESAVAIAIKYANGSKTVINEPANQYSAYTSPEDEQGPDDKSQGIAIGLFIFLGILGVHRFYLGHIGIGVLYLLTGSLCGIGWIIDGILFLTGDLKPKKGKYYDKVI
mgnify:CR=1 FL=1